MTLLTLGIGILAAVAICLALLCRERKAKSTELGPRAGAEHFQAQSEERR